MADVLSRSPLLQASSGADPELVAIKTVVPSTEEPPWGTLIARDELRRAEREDGLYQRVSHWLTRKYPPDTGSGEEYDAYLVSQEEILRYIPQADDKVSNSTFRTVIPRKLRKAFTQIF